MHERSAVVFAMAVLAAACGKDDKSRAKPGAPITCAEFGEHAATIPEFEKTAAKDPSARAMARERFTKKCEVAEWSQDELGCLMKANTIKALDACRASGPKSAALTCEQFGDHMIEVSKRDTDEMIRAAALDPEAAAVTRREFIEECRGEYFTQDELTCLLAGATLDAMTACRVSKR